MKTAAVTMLALTVGLTGCAAGNAAPAASPPASTIYQAVWQDWDGTDRPDETWIDTAAMLVCKQIIGGIEPRVVMDHAENNEVVVSAAEDFRCEVDR